MNFSLTHSAATDALGAALGRAVLAVRAAEPAGAPEGMVLYLQGELGAGKTSLARALLKAVGVEGTIRSPTYTLLDTYLADGLICIHVDLYRLQARREIDELGLRDLTGPDTLLVIEWPERGLEALPRADLTAHIDYDGEGRQVTLHAGSRSGGAWLHELGQDASLSPYVSNLT